LRRQWWRPSPEAIAAGTGAWFRERIDITPALDLARKKTVPSHRLSWIYLLGGAAMFLFGFQVLTGALLMPYYQPTEAAAYESVRVIMTEVPFGWLIRSLHVWGAHTFIAIVAIHLLTTMSTKAYRRPRELTWLTGAVLLVLALAFGFTGYLLPWNELSYYATLVGTQIPGTVPVVGDFFVHLLRGGPQVSGATITRFFSFHVMFLPLMAAGFVGVHVLLVQMQGMSLPLGLRKDKVREHRPFFSEFMVEDAAFWLLLFGAILSLAIFLPGEMGVQADPLAPAPEGIKPEWFFLFMFQLLKYVPETIGVAVFAIAAAFLVFLPFVDRAANQERHSRPVTLVLLALMAGAAVLQVIAIRAPGVEHVAEPLAAPTYNLPWAIVSLLMVWAVIGFLLYGLRQLAAVNTRMRRMYEGGRGGGSGEGVGDGVEGETPVQPGDAQERAAEG
jgi:cytochrome b6